MFRAINGTGDVLAVVRTQDDILVCGIPAVVIATKDTFTGSVPGVVNSMKKNAIALGIIAVIKGTNSTIASGLLTVIRV